MTRADWVIVISAVALLPFLYALYWGNAAPGDRVLVLVNGKEVLAASLATDQEFAVDGPLGTSHIKVHGGQVRFTDSPCANKLCVHTGWLHHGGEFAACLPNRVSLVVSGLNNRYDTINF